MGSRHGLVFAAYALQHDLDYSREVRERAWLAVSRVYLQGDDPARVFAALRSRPPCSAEEWGVDPLPEIRGPQRLSDLTIADLDPHRAHGYPDRVDGWCRSALARWPEQPPPHGP